MSTKSTPPLNPRPVIVEALDALRAYGEAMFEHDARDTAGTRARLEETRKVVDMLALRLGRTKG